MHNEACTVSFGRDVLCQDIIILTGQGDLQGELDLPVVGHRHPRPGQLRRRLRRRTACTSPPPTAPSTRPRCPTATCSSPPRSAQASDDAAASRFGDFQLIEAGIYLARATAAARNPRALNEELTTGVQPSNQDLVGQFDLIDGPGNDAVGRVFLIAPPLLLPLGAVLLGSQLLPRAFGSTAVAFGVASIILGLAALFNATAFSLAIILIIAESAWVLAAAGALVISPKPASGAAEASQPLPHGTGSRTSASWPQ